LIKALSGKLNSKLSHVQTKLRSVTNGVTRFLKNVHKKDVRLSIRLGCILITSNVTKTLVNKTLRTIARLVQRDHEREVLIVTPRIWAVGRTNIAVAKNVLKTLLRIDYFVVEEDHHAESIFIDGIFSFLQN
jgi:3-methyladenine DNA glycosylase AlkD